MELMTWSDGKLEERLDRLDERFDGVNHRITETAETTNRRLTEIAETTDRRLTETAETTDRRLTETAETTDRRLGWVEEEVRGLKKGMHTLHGDIYRATIALWIGSAGVAAAILAKGG